MLMITVTPHKYERAHHNRGLANWKYELAHHVFYSQSHPVRKIKCTPATILITGKWHTGRFDNAHHDDSHAHQIHD